MKYCTVKFKVSGSIKVIKSLSVSGQRVKEKVLRYIAKNNVSVLMPLRNFKSRKLQGFEISYLAFW